MSLKHLFQAAFLIAVIQGCNSGTPAGEQHQDTTEAREMEQVDNILQNDSAREAELRKKYGLDTMR